MNWHHTVFNLKQFDRAIDWYNQAHELAPEDYTITRNIMNAETLKIDDAIITLHQQPDTQAQVNELERLRTQTIVKYLQQMVGERPNDRELRFQLGRVLYETGSIDDAIKTISDIS